MTPYVPPAMDEIVYAFLKTQFFIPGLGCWGDSGIRREGPRKSFWGRGELSGQAGSLLPPEKFSRMLISLLSPLGSAGSVLHAVCDGADTLPCHVPIVPSSSGHSRKFVGLGRLRSTSEHNYLLL